ncbi:hypothetical protein NKR23_g5295 [Pleurostoma richardsiae]|uniref:Secreted protein n=1 Tax=Pleurostoma richardsiae TaxID=41990 RepID=A0AA38RGQ2_9PEZI|nr:hypothetical protein NKR23_g5295 [Pleurostoma richardsiae]
MLFTRAMFPLFPLSALAAPTVSERQSHDVYIQGVTFQGSGCPAGSASVQLLVDGRTFTVIYDKLAVSAGRGTTDSDYQKLCDLSIRFSHTPGYQFGIFTASQRGFCNLQSGDTGLVDVNFGYSEEDEEVRRVTTYKGPIHQDYLKTDDFTASTTHWSSCGTPGTLIVTIEITLDAQDPSGSSQLTVDSTDFQFAHAPTTRSHICSG